MQSKILKCSGVSMINGFPGIDRSPIRISSTSSPWLFSLEGNLRDRVLVRGIHTVAFNVKWDNYRFPINFKAASKCLPRFPREWWNVTPLRLTKDRALIKRGQLIVFASRKYFLHHVRCWGILVLPLSLEKMNHFPFTDHETKKGGTQGVSHSWHEDHAKITESY